jgi:phage shock protein PspC (stress-responsive transcriptional regulator)
MEATLNQPHQDASLAGARNWFRAHGLARPKERRLLGGVSAGLARRYGLSLLVARLTTIAGALLLTPLIYIALWILMPSD